MITRHQIRAARALKGWSQSYLAELCGLTSATVANIELGKQNPTQSTMENIEHIFVLNHIGFSDNDGVYRSENPIITLEGQDGFLEFLQIVDNEAMARPNDEFLVAHVDEREFIRWQGGKPSAKHEETLKRNNILYRILVQEGDDYYPASSYAKYAMTPRDLFQPVPFYIFGNKVALISFENKEVSIIIIASRSIVTLFKKQFEDLWRKSFGKQQT